MPECICCQANSNPTHINPAGPIHVGDFWIVEHAFPCSRLGWTILRLRRHCEALNQLSQAEFMELGNLQYEIVQSLHSLLDTEKEYISCFSEAERFKHIHFHVAPKMQHSKEDEVGIQSFRHLKPIPEAQLSSEEIGEFGRKMNEEMGKRRKK